MAGTLWPRLVLEAGRDFELVQRRSIKIKLEAPKEELLVVCWGVRL